MYRLLLLLTIFALSDGKCRHKHKPSWRHHHSHHWKHHKQPNIQIDEDREFLDLAQKHIELEAAVQNYCINKANNVTSEVYGNENYILKYNIPELKNSNFTVKIINRMIQVKANKGEEKPVFEDVRILPQILDYGMAKWIFEDMTLKIIIPYSITIGKDVVKGCGTLDREEIYVSLLEYPKIDVRMTGLEDANMKNSVVGEENKQDGSLKNGNSVANENNKQNASLKEESSVENSVEDQENEQDGQFVFST